MLQKIDILKTIFLIDFLPLVKFYELMRILEKITAEKVTPFQFCLPHLGKATKSFGKCAFSKSLKEG